jgi:hypothetical protein
VSAQEIPSGLVKIDAPDTLQGYALVEIGSPAHVAAEQAAADARAAKEAAEAEEAAKVAAAKKAAADAKAGK